MEPERAQHIALWAMAHGASPNKGWSLVRRAFELSEERLEIAIGRLQQQVEPYPGLAEELHYLQTAPLSELNSPRSPQDLAEYALYRYPTFYRCEAPQPSGPASPRNPPWKPCSSWGAPSAGGRRIRKKRSPAHSRRCSTPPDRAGSVQEETQ